VKHRKLQVRDLMTSDPVVADTEMSLYDAYALMFENEIRRLPVLAHRRLAGIITLGDIQRALPSAFGAWETATRLQATTLTVGDVMSPDPITVAPEDTIQEAAAQMLENQVSGLPVVEDERVVGIVTESDIFRLVVSSWSEEGALTRT
jgi:acetoin utilization protein AcuB